MEIFQNIAKIIFISHFICFRPGSVYKWGRKGVPKQQIRGYFVKNTGLTGWGAPYQISWCLRTYLIELLLLGLLGRYDKEMFHRYNTIKGITEDYTKELHELADIETEFTKVDEKRQEILEENQKEEDLRRQKDLQRIRAVVAAKAIQRGWKQYKTRKLLKSKKKRRKKTNA